MEEANQLFMLAVGKKGLRNNNFMRNFKDGGKQNLQKKRLVK